MSDLLDLYNQGAFTKSDNEDREQERRPEQENPENKSDNTVDFLKLLSDLEAGRNFFSEYVGIILDRKRQELANKNFSLDDLYDNPDRNKENESRKEREDRFISGRKKDFVEYVKIINQFVKALGGQDE